MSVEIKNKTLLITYSAVFTSLVFIFTVMFSLYIPETRGFFNIGEAGVYITALIGGPIVGFIAGGLGSMLADLSLGYYWYAPATFLIKAAEGFIVGYLSKRVKFKGKASSMGIGSIATVVGGFILYRFGSDYYVGGAELTLQIPLIFGGTVTVQLVSLVWLVLATVFTATILLSILMDPGSTGLIISMMLGGMEMILGYYLYEQLILQYAAIAEVPFNVMQMLVGTMMATYIFKGFSLRSFGKPT